MSWIPIEFDLHTDKDVDIDIDVVSVVQKYPEVEQATPEIEVDNTGLITAKAKQAKGLVEDGTKTTTKQLTTKAAMTITPSTTAQTVAAGTYLTGDLTIEGDENLVSANIVSGKTIFGKAGSAVTVKAIKLQVYNFTRRTLTLGYVGVDGRGTFMTIPASVATGLSRLTTVQVMAESMFSLICAATDSRGGVGYASTKVVSSSTETMFTARITASSPSIEIGRQS